MWSTTLHQGQFHRFLFFCCVLLCYVLLCDLPPFIKVNSTASYSFVVYCYVMYCYVIYHPSSRSIPPLLILLLCIVMLCIVRSRTTLHHSQFHQVKVIRNSEVLLPNFLWWVYEYMRIWVYEYMRIWIYEIYHYIHSMTHLSLSLPSSWWDSAEQRLQSWNCPLKCLIASGKGTFTASVPGSPSYIEAT